MASECRIQGRKEPVAVHYDGHGHCYVHPSSGEKCEGDHGYARPRNIKEAKE